MTGRASDPLHVGLIHPFSWPEVRRGGERYLDDLASHLARTGHRVEVITGTDGRSGVEERDDGVVVRRLHHVLSEQMARRDISKVDAFGLAVAPRLLRHRFDVVHALVPSAALAARLARTPTVFTILGHPTRDQLGARRIDETLFRRAVAGATACMALSRASAAVAREVFGGPVGVLPPGVRLDRFPPKEATARPPRVLFTAAADEPRKRLDLVLEAFGLLLERRPDARLELAGPGDPGWALAGLGRDQDRVRSAVDVLGPGALDDVPLRYREATVTVLPSRNEAFGLVLVESLASGTPVVCTDEGGMPEIVDSPAVGRVAPRDDVVALAAALGDAIELAADPATVEQCAAHARRWGWDEVGAQHEHVYRMVLAGRHEEVVRGA